MVHHRARTAIRAALWIGGLLSALPGCESILGTEPTAAVSPATGGQGGDAGLDSSLSDTDGGGQGGDAGLDSTLSDTDGEAGPDSGTDVVVHPNDPTTPEGDWYVEGHQTRLSIKFWTEAGLLLGVFHDDDHNYDCPVKNATWDSSTRVLEFLRDCPAFSQWYRGTIVQGTFAGRFSHADVAAKPEPHEFLYPFRGWSPDWVQKNTKYTRTWDIEFDTNRAVLRLDYDAEGGLRGRMKVYHRTDDSSLDNASEGLESDLTDISWDGNNLAFTSVDPVSGKTRLFKGFAYLRRIDQGAYQEDGGPPQSWSGHLSQALGFGLGSRVADRSAWQEVTRQRLANITEGSFVYGDWPPAVSAVEEEWAPAPSPGPFADTRDDDPNANPSSYQLRKLQLSYVPTHRFEPSAVPPPRIVKGVLSKPSANPPAKGFRSIIVLTGHGGYASDLFKSDGPFWYGDSAARRSFVVLALELGHRTSAFPPRGYGTPKGPKNGPILGAGHVTTDWEENAERSYDVRRAIDYLSTLPYVDPSKIFIAGLEMGAEVGVITAAMDTRVAGVVASGYRPDVHGSDWMAENCNCYKWFNSSWYDVPTGSQVSIHEYFDNSDYLALIAPRLAVIETGRFDTTFSSLPAPFASAKECVRRARAAYDKDASMLIHFLHGGKNEFRVGALNPSHPDLAQGVLETVNYGPAGDGAIGWQTDEATTVRSPSIYHLIEQLSPQ